MQADFHLPARRPSERLAIATAVFDGGSSLVETDWIEWKSSYDLRRPAHRAATARHLLGFANRDPDRAARNAGGLGYLLIGVEPGRADGVPEVWDPAMLESWLTPFVGGELAWDPQYVELGNRRILFITVEAPRWGDPPYPLRKEGTDEAGKALRNGWLFIRKPGKTDQATATDIDMLAGRLRQSRNRLRLEVSAVDVPTAVPAAVLSDGARDRYLDETYDALIAPLRETYFMSPIGESRDRDEFAQEVDDYILDAKTRWFETVVPDLIDERFGRFVVRIRNPTEHVFENVQLELRLSVGMRHVAIDSAAAADQLRSPRRPPEWGKGLLANVSFRDDRAVPEVRETEGEALIRFVPTLVRPHSWHELDAVYLVLPPDAAGARSVTGQWRATSTSVEGEAVGTLAFEVANHDTDA